MPFKVLNDFRNGRSKVARPERFELPTTAFEAQYSIQLSYGRADKTFDRRVGRSLITPPPLRKFLFFLNPDRTGLTGPMRATPGLLRSQVLLR